MRNCALCNAPDSLYIEIDLCNCRGESEHSEGCAAVQHFVVCEIRHHQGIVSRAMQAQGWEIRGTFQGKQAIQRLSCRNCIRKQAEIVEIDAYRRRKGIEAEGESEMTVYQVLCN